MRTQVFHCQACKPWQSAVGRFTRAWPIVLLMQCLFASPAVAQNIPGSAQSLPSTNRTGVNVSLPNGYATISAEDMRLMTSAGEVRWMRQWDGQEWKFQPQWESLSQSWKNLTGSQSADTMAGTVSGGSNGGAALSSSGSGSGGGCWVWVDEDWQPSVGSAAQADAGT